MMQRDKLHPFIRPPGKAGEAFQRKLDASLHGRALLCCDVRPVSGLLRPTPAPTIINLQARQRLAAPPGAGRRAVAPNPGV
jgi:hypothetical protein